MARGASFLVSSLRSRHDAKVLTSYCRCNAREHENVDLGLAGTVIIPPGDRSSEFVQAQHARQRQSRFTLAMNTRQNVPIEDDEPTVVRNNPAQDATRTNRRNAVSNVFPDRPDVRRETASVPGDRPAPGQRATIDLTSPAGRPRTNEPVVRMDVDREQTLEPMDVEGLGVGLGAGLTRNGAVEGEGAAAFWSIPGAAVFRNM
jgi:hypothetical protein